MNRSWTYSQLHHNQNRYSRGRSIDPLIQTETLQLLEWSRLCQHLSTFAATKLGAIAAQHHPIPDSETESRHLLALTQEAYQLEMNLANGLSFGGLRDL